MPWKAAIIVAIQLICTLAHNRHSHASLHCHASPLLSLAIPDHQLHSGGLACGGFKCTCIQEAVRWFQCNCIQEVVLVRSDSCIQEVQACRGLQWWSCRGKACTRATGMGTTITGTATTAHSTRAPACCCACSPSAPPQPLSSSCCEPPRASTRRMDSSAVAGGITLLTSGLSLRMLWCSCTPCLLPLCHVSL